MSSVPFSLPFYSCPYAEGRFLYRLRLRRSYVSLRSLYRPKLRLQKSELAFVSSWPLGWPLPAADLPLLPKNWGLEEEEGPFLLGCFQLMTVN